MSGRHKGYIKRYLNTKYTEMTRIILHRKLIFFCKFSVICVLVLPSILSVKALNNEKTIF